jgi:proline iminopeptidase
MTLNTLRFFLATLFMSVSINAQKDAYIQFEDNVIHLTAYGEGQAILILNGGPGMNSEGFKPLAKILGRSNKVIIYDQRGTGQSKIAKTDSNTITMDSMAHDIEAIRKYLHLDNWIVLGHSFGGMLASYYASKYPERIKGLILSSSGGINMDLFSRLSITSRLTTSERDSLNFWNARIAKG